jgi:hypothetical protein
VLLRYLSYVYHALAQTIPDLSKTDEVRSIEDYFGSMIRDVDSSLLDEWRNIDDSSVAGDGSGVAAAAEIAAAALSQAEKLRMEKDLRILARNAVFRFLRAFSQGDFVAALRVLNAATVGPNAAAEVNWTEESLASTHEELKAERGALLFHAAARSPDLTHFFEENEDDAVSGDGVKSSGPRTWRLEQTLLDESEFNDCCAVFLFNCEKSFAQKRAVISLREIRK